MEEYEKEEVRDSVESNDSIQNTTNDSIAGEVEDTTSTSSPSIEDEAVKFKTFSVFG